jgi:hypothetical protein
MILMRADCSHWQQNQAHLKDMKIMKDMKKNFSK